MPEAPGERIVWRVHPAAERPRMGLLVALLVVVLSILAGLWMKQVFWSLFAMMVLFLSLEAFFLPSRFELGADGVAVKKPFSRLTRPWSYFRRVTFDEAGASLSPFAQRRWIEPYRAIRLTYGAAGDSAAVRDFILAQIDREKVGIEGLGVTPEEKSVTEGGELT